MKCATCNHTGEILGFYEKENGEKFIPIELQQLNGYGVGVGRQGLNTKYKLVACPKCGTLKLDR
jgi:hypothetical protein